MGISIGLAIQTSTMLLFRTVWASMTRFIRALRNELTKVKQSLLARQIISVCLIASIAGNALAQDGIADSGFFVYGVWSGDDGQGLVISPPPPGGVEGSFSWGDAFTLAVFCPSTSRFVCFMTDRYSFAYPKKRKADESSWTHDGVTYEIVKEGLTQNFLGRRLEDVMLIKQPKESTVLARHFGTEYFYLYSASTGIIAFGNQKCSAGRYAEFYWLAQEKGFGAVAGPEGR